MVTSRLFVYRLCASTARFLFSTFVCDFCMLPDMFTMSGTCVLAWPHSWHFSAASAMETIVVVFIVVCVLCRGSACWKILRAYHDVVRRWLGYSWLKNMVVRRWLGRLAALASCAGWVAGFAGWLCWLAVLAGGAGWLASVRPNTSLDLFLQPISETLEMELPPTCLHFIPTCSEHFRI